MKRSAKKKPSSKAGIRKGAKKAPTARKAAKAPRTKKTAANKARTPVIAVGGIVQQIADMMARPVGHKDAPLGGASMAEMVKATGILAHPMRAKIKLVRDRLGYTTFRPSKENGHRYSARPPAEKC